MVNGRYRYKYEAAHKGNIKAMQDIGGVIDVDEEGMPACLKQSEVGSNYDDGGDKHRVVDCQIGKIESRLAKLCKLGFGDKEVGSSHKV